MTELVKLKTRKCQNSQNSQNDPCLGAVFREISQFYDKSVFFMTNPCFIDSGQLVIDNGPLLIDNGPLLTALRHC